MTDKREGGCLCGAVRFEAILDDQNTNLCHCRDCQLNSGAPYGCFTNVKADKFKWLSEPDGSRTETNDAHRRFCTKCGSSLNWESIKYPNSMAISTACFDDASGLVPTAELWTVDRMDGFPLISGAAQYDGDKE